jgi:hypothetical protein
MSIKAYDVVDAFAVCNFTLNITNKRPEKKKEITIAPVHLGNTVEHIIGNDVFVDPE